MEVVRPWRPDIAARSPSGFTLVEMVVAAALGAALFVAAAHSSTMFAQTVAQLDDGAVSELDVAVARINRDVRYAWWVEVPASDRLIICDALEAITIYRLVGDELQVDVPEGGMGVLASGIESLTFETRHMRRLREGPTAIGAGVLHTAEVPIAPLKSVELTHGNEIALGFTLEQVLGPDSVADVDEHVVSATAQSLTLPLQLGEGLGSLLRVSLHESRAHGDARPRDDTPALAVTTIPLDALPSALPDPDWVDTVEPLLAGPKYLPPVTETTLNLPFAGIEMLPGVGYTLVLTMVGPGSISVLASTDKSPDWTVCRRDDAALNFAQLARLVPFQLSGVRVQTTTLDRQVVASVLTDVSAGSGQHQVASASVYSQLMLADPWLGVVPGEVVPAP